MRSSSPAMLRRLALGCFAMLLSTGAWAAASVCSHVASTLLTACAADKNDTYLVATATCQNISDVTARNACLDDAQAQRKDDTANCHDVYRARLDVCDAVGEERYEPPFGPDFAGSFVDPTEMAAPCNRTRTFRSCQARSGST